MEPLDSLRLYHYEYHNIALAEMFLERCVQDGTLMHSDSMFEVVRINTPAAIRLAFFDLQRSENSFIFTK